MDRAEGGGLVRYKDGVFRSFGVADGLTNGFVRAIHEDRNNTLWVGTDRGFFQQTGERFNRLDGTAEVPLATATGIGEDEEREHLGGQFHGALVGGGWQIAGRP